MKQAQKQAQQNEAGDRAGVAQEQRLRRPQWKAWEQRLVGKAAEKPGAAQRGARHANRMKKQKQRRRVQRRQQRWVQRRQQQWVQQRVRRRAQR